MRMGTTMLSICWLALVVGVCCFGGHAALAQTINAFPTAKGFGAGAAGGRGGSVYHVTNLNDSGDGSLRNGIDSAAGPTTIVFDTGGTVQLQSPLRITKNNLTIAGQTAPGDGIAVVGCSTIVQNTNDVIIRHMRFRAGDQNGMGQDSLAIADSKRVIIDHVSTAWGTDESLSVTRSNNVTVQNCIVAETLNAGNHAYGSLVRGNVDVDNTGGYTFSHNVWISNDRRNPGIGSYQQTDKTATLDLDLVNNVIYNWGSRSIHTVQSTADMHVNLVNNMFIAGPSTSNSSEVMRVESDQSALFGYPGKVFVYESGNLIDSDKDATHAPRATSRAMFADTILNRIIFNTTSFTYPTTQTQDAQAAYLAAMAHAGASLHRDSVDSRLISDVMNRTGGIITSQNDLGGFAVLRGGTAPLDADRDGMPDAWERSHGFNPSNVADGNGVASNGYTNLENYLNTLTGELTVPEPSGIRVPLSEIPHSSFILYPSTFALPPQWPKNTVAKNTLDSHAENSIPTCMLRNRRARPHKVL